MTLIRPILVSALHIAALLLIACSASQATPAEEVSPKVSPSTSASPSASQTSTPVQGVTTTPTPVSSNSTQEIPPCTPLESISVDPCQRDAEPLERVLGGAGGGPDLGDEPRSLRGLLENIPGLDSHIVVRGTYLPDAERCTTGNPYRPPSYLSNEQYDNIVNALLINCYVDLRVADYILGSGPSTLTVLRHFFSYRVGAAQAADIEQATGMSERAWFEDYSQRLEGEEYMGGLAGREEVLFIGPASSLSVEVWRAFAIWDVQQREDGTVIAVHPDRDLWRRLRPDDYQTHLSTLEMELPAFKQAVTAAHQARVTEYGGRIGPSDAEGIIQGAELPMLISNVDRLDEYYTAVGSYAHPDGPPAQPLPVPTCANGTVITDPGSNRGLVYDCEVLLAAKDTLRGTATLNWSVDTPIASWDGVSVSGTPGRVRGLDLSDEGLDGAIPGELGDLYELTALDLSDNSLTRGIPVELGWLYNLEEVRLSGQHPDGLPTRRLEVGGHQRPVVSEPPLLPAASAGERRGGNPRRDQRGGELGRGAQHQQVPSGVL